MARCTRFVLPSVSLWNLTQNIGQRELQFAPRALINYQQIRGTRKRSSFHYTIWKPWWRRRKARFDAYKDVTTDNKEFIKEVIEDKYAAVIRNSPLKEAPWERGQWTMNPLTIRTGVLALKIGVIPQWTKEGRKIYTTLLQVLDNHVVDYMPPEQFVKSENCKDKWKGSDMKGKYGLCVVGAMSSDPHLYTPSYNQLFEKAGIPPKRKLAKFIVTPNAKIKPGTPLTAMHFKIGHYVDVYGKTISRGNQGVMIRWGMKGGPASHGTTKSHRRMGATGGGLRRGIWKGKKMPGRMGGDMTRLRGQKIMRIDTKHNILYIKGPAVPGPCHGYVKVVDTVLRHRKEKVISLDPPFMPTAYPEDFPDALPEEIFDEELFKLNEDTIKFAEEAK